MQQMSLHKKAVRSPNSPLYNRKRVGESWPVLVLDLNRLFPNQYLKIAATNLLLRLTPIRFCKSHEQALLARKVFSIAGYVLTDQPKKNVVFAGPSHRPVKNGERALWLGEPPAIGCPRMGIDPVCGAEIHGYDI